MNKKILIGAVFAASLLVFMPIVSSFEQSQIRESTVIKKPVISLNQIIEQLLNLYDSLVDLNNPVIQESLDEFLYDINILIQGQDGCDTLENIYVFLFIVWAVMGMMSVMFLWFLVKIYAAGKGCDWALENYEPTGYNTCNCVQTAIPTTDVLTGQCVNGFLTGRLTSLN